MNQVDLELAKINLIYVALFSEYLLLLLIDLQRNALLN